jgi:type IV pilus assembly protein PilQ
MKGMTSRSTRALTLTVLYCVGGLCALAGVAPALPAKAKLWAGNLYLLAAVGRQQQVPPQQEGTASPQPAPPSGQQVPIPSTNGSAWEMTLPTSAGTNALGQAVGQSPDSDSSLPASGAPTTATGSGGSNYYPGGRSDNPPPYTGEPISVDLRDVDLKDFFRLIHEISGLNIVLDPAVKGTLTIVLTDVPWDQALDIVLRNNGLDKQLNGNVLRIATIDTLRKEADDDAQLARAEAMAEGQVTVTRSLSYAKADQLIAPLKKFLTARGDILADPRSNMLIIHDVPGAITVIDGLLKQLDRKSQQVEIEARVVAASRSFSRELGSQLAFAFASGNSVLGGNPLVGSSPVNHATVPLPLAGSGSSGTSGLPLPLNTNLGAATATSGLSYVLSAGKFQLDDIISAAETKGIGKLLSKPRIATQNNVKATVKQGVEIPIQTIVNNTISVQYVNAVLELEVTPQITADGTVYLDVHVENTQIDTSIPRVEGIPALDTESADTKILINDGGTIVIGGIIISSQQTNLDQVPLLGDIPVLGNLFKHQTVMTSSSELLFFLTPRILPG